MTDVTNQVHFGANDGEMLPITKCVCGERFKAWDAVVGIYPEDPWTCPKCGARLIFSANITVTKLEGR